jgi:hypothetical protein
MTLSLRGHFMRDIVASWEKTSSIKKFHAGALSPARNPRSLCI